MKKERRKILSVDKTFNILEIIMDNRQPMSLKELAAITGYPKSTIHGLLAEMIDHEVITQDADGTYYLGRRLLEYGFSVYTSWGLIQLTHPFLDALCHQTGLNAILGSVDKGFMVNVNFRMGSDAESYKTSFVGVKSPLHATAQGKVFLASYDDKIINRIVGKEGLKKYTPNTITDMEILMTEIQAIRKHGYAVGNSEFNENIKVISVPVYNRQKQVIFALGVLGSSTQIREENISSIAKILKQESKRMSKLLEKEIG